MIDFKRIEDALRDEVLRALSGVTTDVRWDWQPPQMASAMTVLLKRSPMAFVGFDGSAFEANGSKLDEHRIGQRSFRLEVRAESHVGSPRTARELPASSDDVLAMVVTRIRRRQAVDRLLAAGCSLTDVSGIARTTYSRDGVRETRAAILTIGFLCADVDKVTAPDSSGDFFDTVEGTVNGGGITAP